MEELPLVFQISWKKKDVNKVHGDMKSDVSVNADHDNPESIKSKHTYKNSWKNAWLNKF